MPIFYECDRCTACCRWPGQVSLVPEQIATIAAFLGITESEFIEQFTRLNRARTGLALGWHCRIRRTVHAFFWRAAIAASSPSSPNNAGSFPTVHSRVDGKDQFQRR